MLKRNIIGLLAILALGTTVFAAAAQDATPESTMSATSLPDTITINVPGLQPEGIEYDATRGKLLVGSISQSSVSIVNDDGTLTTLLQDPKLKSVIGLQIDAAHNRLLLASTDMAKLGQLGIYDLQSGAQIHVVDLAALTPDAQSHFPNDIAIDKDGNAYVADSNAGVFYKVDMDGNASVFLQDPSFVGSFVLNGIDYNPNGYLVAVRSPDLIKIPLDNPQSFSVVKVNGDVSGGDGIIFSDAKTLNASVGNPKHVVQLTSDDDWATATITGDFQVAPGSATTIAIRDGVPYVTDAQFANANAQSYVIKKVMFSAPAMGEATVESTADMSPSETTPEPTAAG
jgi:sugar lactone lactonase YvrE